MMAFPSSGAIGASDIRANMANNNTAGAQTNVSLNDTPVRAAANVPSGTISYNQLHGVRVLWCGLVTFGRYAAGTGFGTIIYTGFANPPGIGSINTTTYYGGNNGEVWNYRYTYDNSNRTYVRISGTSPLSSAVSTIYVNLDTTRYTLNANAASTTYWEINGDPMDLYNRNGGTYWVVVTA